MGLFDHKRAWRHTYLLVLVSGSSLLCLGSFFFFTTTNILSVGLSSIFLFLSLPLSFFNDEANEIFELDNGLKKQDELEE